MKKILVVVDMQNDFIDGPLGTPESRAIVDNVCVKIRDGEWDWIIRTMDTHGDISYFNTQEGKKLPVGHCFVNTHGWCSNEDVRNAIQEAAAKADNNGYCRTSLIKKDTFGSHELLREISCRLLTTEWIDTRIADIELTLIGVCTDICVISNTLLLKAACPEMNIVVDAACCAGTTPEKHRMALEVMKSCQVDVVNMPCDWVMLIAEEYMPVANVLRMFDASED